MNKLPRTLVAFTLITLFYLVLSIALPPNSATIQSYHLSVTEYRVLALLVGIPLVAVWFASFYGYARLDEYVASIQRTQEGRAFALIARGLRYLAWGLPIISIVTTILGGIVHSHNSFANTAFIIAHYLPVIIAIAAFWQVGNGSRLLTEIAKVRPTNSATRTMFASFTLLGVFFTYVSIRTAQSATDPYHLPMWLILLTLIVPYLYAWFMGLFASYEIVLYSQRSRGFLYSRSLRDMATGIIVTIVTSVLFQYTQSDTTRLRRISFSWVFLGIYLLLMLYASGFLLIGHGAKQLQKMEEV